MDNLTVIIITDSISMSLLVLYNFWLAPVFQAIKVFFFSLNPILELNLEQYFFYKERLGKWIAES